MKRSPRARGLVFTALFAVLAASREARAEGTDKASAEALFDEGRKLMEAGDFSNACPKFEASQQADPGVGTMLYLADCYEKTGRTATAWAQFREVISAAHNAGSADRERIATDRARALEPRLAYLTIVPWKGQAIVVTRDGKRVEDAALGSAIPVDPGGHVVVATAPGKREWSTNVVVADGAKVSVSVPILPEDSGAGAGGTAPGAPAPATADSGTGGSQRTWALVAGGVGLAGVVVGTVFGFSAKGKWNDAKSGCDPYPDACTQHSLDLADDARSAAAISTVGFIVGAVGLAGGAVLWFTAPSAQGSQVSAGVGPGSLLVRGSF